MASDLPISQLPETGTAISSDLFAIVTDNKKYNSSCYQLWFRYR